MSTIIEWIGILAPGILLILSELIGASKLKSNGVIELIVDILKALQANKQEPVIGKEVNVDSIKSEGTNPDDMS